MSVWLKKILWTSRYLLPLHRDETIFFFSCLNEVYITIQKVNESYYAMNDGGDKKEVP